MASTFQQLQTALSALVGQALANVRLAADYLAATQAAAATAVAVASQTWAEPDIISASTYNWPAGHCAGAIERNAPSLTTILLPPVAQQFVGTIGVPIRLVDWSTNVGSHQIIFQANAGETIMQIGTLEVDSTASQLASITLIPSKALSGWYIG